MSETAGAASGTVEPACILSVQGPGAQRDLVDAATDPSGQPVHRDLADPVSGLSGQPAARSRRDLIIDAAKRGARPAELTALDVALAAHLADESLERSRAR